MDWYLKISKAAATQNSPKPPSYLIERVSDLEHACDLIYISPKEAKRVLSEVSDQLLDHHDDAFVAPLGEAARIMLDSPSKAKEMVERVASAMMLEKKRQDAQRRREESWNKAKL
jgi:predicted ATPase with chaperone activity